MKKAFSYLLFMLLLAVTTVFTACEKMDTPVKSNENFRVNIPLGVPDTIFTGREVSFDVEVIAEAGLEKVELRKDFQLIEGSIQTYDGKPTKGTYHFSFKADRFDVGRNFTFVIAAYDKDGATTTANYAVVVKAAPVLININIPDTAPDTVLLTQELAFTVPVTSEQRLTAIKTLRNGIELPALTKTSFADSLADQYAFAYTTVEDDAGTLLTFTFKVTDKEEKEKTVEYTVFVKGERPPKPVVNYSVMLGGQLSTANGHFLNAAAGSVHFRAGVAAISADIDLLTFVSGSSTGVNVTAPSFQNSTLIYTAANSGSDALVSWPVRNATELVRVTTNVSPVRFAAVQMDSEVVEIFDAGSAKTDNINRIVVNDVIAFKTVKGKHGLILVTAIPANNKGSLSIDVKMQP